MTKVQEKRHLSATGTAPQVSLKKTEDCVFVTTHFRMGIGRMRQVNLTVITNADPDQLRHQKKLIDSPELEKIRSQDGFLQRYLDSVSCQYSKATRFLPNAAAEPVYRAMKAYQQIRRPALVAAFMAKYRELEAVNFEPLSRPAPEGLGDLFDRGDYPSSETVEANFEFSYELRPVGQVELKGLPDYIIAEEVEKDKQRRAVAVSEWTGVMRVALLGVVDSLFDVLKPQIDGKKRTLKEAHVANMLNFCRTFPSRNLGDDAESQKAVETINALMNGVSAEQLRHSDNLKVHVAKQLSEVRAGLTTLVQATGRKFR